MTPRLYGCVCGHLHSPAASMGLPGEETVAFPVPFYVVDHPKGLALFDCGMNRGLMDESDPYRRAIAQAGMAVEMAPAQTVAARLAALDIAPTEVRYVVLSHLHFDHAGGLDELPNATVVVQAREWAAGFDEGEAARYFLPRAYFDLGHEVMTIEGEHDLFGDGTVACLPSPGHTPGHQSLRVRSEAGDHILTADACYFCQVVESRRFPAFADAEAMNHSLDQLLAVGDAGTAYVWGHDPAQWGEEPVLPTVRA